MQRRRLVGCRLLHPARLTLRRLYHAVEGPSCMLRGAGLPPRVRFGQGLGDRELVYGRVEIIAQPIPTHTRATKQTFTCNSSRQDQLLQPNLPNRDSSTLSHLLRT